MPFLAVTCFLMYAHLFAALRYVRRGERFAGAFVGAHTVAGLAGSVAFLFGTELLVVGRGGSIAGDAYNWTPVAYLIFGALSAALFAIKLVGKARDHSEKRSTGVLFGMALWAVLASVYVSMTAVDHFVFFRDREHSGQMDVTFAGEQMTCSGGVLLVRTEGDSAVYRCPTSIRLGADYQTPFVPWPGYTQGSSTKLKARIDAITEEISKAPNVISVPASDVRISPSAGAKNK